MRKEKSMSASIAQTLGSMKTEAKAKASALNGRMGGRPRKDGTKPVGQSYHAAIVDNVKLESKLKGFQKKHRGLISPTIRDEVGQLLIDLADQKKEWAKQLKNEQGGL
jgi:hypothetical protein